MWHVRFTNIPFTYSSTHLFELEEDLTSDLHVVLLDVLQRDDDALVCAQRDSPVGGTDSEVCYLYTCPVVECLKEIKCRYSLLQEDSDGELYICSE